jgi:hypothetical protein
LERDQRVRPASSRYCANLDADKGAHRMRGTFS